MRTHKYFLLVKPKVKELRIVKPKNNLIIVEEAETA